VSSESSSLAFPTPGLPGPPLLGLGRPGEPTASLLGLGTPDEPAASLLAFAAAGEPIAAKLTANNATTARTCCAGTIRAGIAESYMNDVAVGSLAILGRIAVD